MLALCGAQRSCFLRFAQVRVLCKLQVYAPVDGPPSTQGVQGALCELSAALRLLCAICTHDPQTALDLLHVEVPAGDASLADGGGGPDMLTLACHAVTVLCQVEEPPMEAIGTSE